MSEIRLSKEEAKRFLVHYQGLLKQPPIGGKEAIVNYIQKVGCIQFDPLNVVGRNPDLVLQSRIKDYTPQLLEDLLYKERKLIDGWDKMMAIYSVEDWPHFKRVRARHTKSNIGVMDYRGTTDALDCLEQVKAIIQSEGAKLSREIKIGGTTKGEWGSGKNANVALDHLYHLGELGIATKKNNQKVFDVIENLLPVELLEAEDPFPNDHEFLKWYVKRRIGSVGMLWSKNGGGWLGHFISNKNHRDKIIQELVDEKSLLPVTIEGMAETFYIRAEDVDVLRSANEPYKKEVRILAPLDNLLWDRTLVEKIFDFKYTWEVYVPESKRKYGYYVLPVLYGENIVARFEPLKHVKGSPLQIKNWWWEEGVEITEALLTEVEMGLEAFAKYLGVPHGAKDYLSVIHHVV